MIADLRGRTVFIVAAPPPLAEAFDEAFSRHGAKAMRISVDGLDAALEPLRCAGHHLDALVVGSSAGTAPPLTALEDYGVDRLNRSIADGAWPVFAVLQRARAALGRFPRHVVALAADHSGPGDDFAAASDAALETLCRHASGRMAGDDARMNVLRYRLASDANQGRGIFAAPREVANAAVALCSGLLDAMRGEVLTVDRGASFCDNVFRDFEANESRGK